MNTARPHNSEFVNARGGITLRAGPAREACFTIVTDQADMSKFNESSPEHRREFLHGNLNEEVQSLEIAAQSIADFPDAPWEIRLHLARQCWDETRHARLFLRRLLDLDGHKGEFPIINQEWGVVCMFDSLAARLAIQNRVFEGGSLDVLKESADVWSRWGDRETYAILDGIAADEIQHAKFANEWLAVLKARDPRSLLKAVAAMNTLKAWTAALTPPGHKLDHQVQVNRLDRSRAGFDVD